MAAEQELFLAVVAQAVRDYRRGCRYAEAWLFSPLYLEDFRTVCGFANVEPEFVHELARRKR
jgi:hypothetical protein